MKFQLIVTILLLTDLGSSVIIKKNTQNKDMSEHCRRRVVPSVFLGREVAESSAKVMHFSRLDMPYSCSMGIRTESGSNIILVIILKSDMSLVSSCEAYHDQLLVYEIGETFGGYWGAVPERMLRQKPRNSTVYTLKTTQPTEKSADIEALTEKDILNDTKDILSLTTRQDETDENFIVMEVPLVNVSGNVEFSDSMLTHRDDEELFDLIYDVTPRNGVLYDTTIMPLVQFSIWKQHGGHRDGFEDLVPRYQLDYGLRSYTPDYRLMYKTNNRRSYPFRPFYSTRRLKFKKKNMKHFNVNHLNRKNKSQIVLNTHYKFNTRPAYITESPKKSLSKTNIVDFTYLKKHPTYKIAKNLSNYYNGKKNDDASDLLKILKLKYNTTVYPEEVLFNFQHNNLSAHNNSNLGHLLHNNITQYTIPSFSVNSSQQLKSSSFVNYTSPKIMISDSNQSLINTTLTMASNRVEIKTESTLSLTQSYVITTMTTVIPSVTGSDIEKRKDLESTKVFRSEVERYLTTKNSETSRKSKAGSLVDHESWENVVKIAPVMADHLNVTAPINEDNSAFSESIPISATEKVLELKKNINKRYIQALSIEENGPRQLSTKENKATSQEFNNLLFDSQNLAEIVELQDDEIQGRVALRYFKSYAGSAMFNICDYDEAKARHVYLFNSSRIMIAINNFMMESMTIVITETRVAKGRTCPPAHLECQVSGVRVCVHHMNACDGIPNCGARDVYDEDRLLCGDNVGFLYTVCMAACTAMAVVLTLLYSVHYWLKRCVPKVSQAFFVYADKSENILFLDSIMRSPNDFDIGNRMVYNSSFFEADLSTDSNNEDDKTCVNIMRRCLNFIICKKPNKRYSEEVTQEDLSHNISSVPKRRFTFTEIELNKITPKNAINASVQTGDSLEAAHSKKLKLKIDELQTAHKNSNRLGTKISLVHSENQLKNLRRMRSMSTSFQSSLERDKAKTENKLLLYPAPVTEEVELQSTVYDSLGQAVLPRKVALEKIDSEILSEPGKTKERHMLKHLRFEEEAKTIPSPSICSEDEGNIHRQRRGVLGDDILVDLDPDNIDEYEEPASSSGRDFMRFWGSGKGKKSKKKSHLALR